MRPDAYTARAYQRMEEAMQRVERWLSAEIRPAFGYTTAALGARIAQAMVMRMTDPYLRQSVEAYSMGRTDFVSGLPDTLECGEISVNTRTGATRPTVKLVLFCVAKFVALWLLVLAQFARSLVYRRYDPGAATLVHGIPDADMRANGNAGRFEDFARRGPLKVLANASRCMVQAARPVTAGDSTRFVYTRIPLLTLFAANRPGVRDALHFLCAHLHVLSGFILMVARRPITALLWRDMGLHAVALTLNRRKLIQANVITNTNWLQQFLWMNDLPDRHFKTVMPMYSLNSSGLVFEDDPVAAPHPSLRHLKTDVIYIWDAAYEKVLRSDRILCATQVVNPILWYMPPPVLPSPSKSVRRICAFDISPILPEVQLNRGLLGSYYNATNMKRFLDDIVAASELVAQESGTPVEIVLKHKRTPTPIHDRTYFSYVQQLVEAHDCLRLAEEDANLFSLIAESDLVIVVPFSSPTYVAAHLGVPSLYYDPTAEVLAAQSGVPVASFTGGRGNLVREIAKALRLSPAQVAEATPQHKA